MFDRLLDRALLASELMPPDIALEVPPPRAVTIMASAACCAICLAASWLAPFATALLKAASHAPSTALLRNEVASLTPGILFKTEPISLPSPDTLSAPAVKAEMPPAISMSPRSPPLAALPIPLPKAAPAIGPRGVIESAIGSTTLRTSPTTPRPSFTFSFATVL